jgi:hypothetical protein
MKIRRKCRSPEGRETNTNRDRRKEKREITGKKR